MGLVSVKEILKHARKNQYAVGHFDVHNLEWTQAVLEAAKQLNSPVILGVTEDAVQYFYGFSTAKDLVTALMRDMKITVPVALHLDHGTSIENCKAAINAGFTSVMIDASSYPFEENIRITKEVVDYAHPRGVTVEAEIGHIGGKEGSVSAAADQPIYADLQECIKLVEITSVDMLAPALGSAHGIYKGEPKIDFEKMQEISQATQIPLVLHGASGLDPEQIKQAILSGTAKINVNADNHLAFTRKIREILLHDQDLYDATTYIREGQQAVKEMVMAKITLFGSVGKAKHH